VCVGIETHAERLQALRFQLGISFDMPVLLPLAMSVYADVDQSLWLLALCIGAADYTAQEPGRLYIYRRAREVQGTLIPTSRVTFSKPETCAGVGTGIKKK
jgi:hypothetical protein